MNLEEQLTTLALAFPQKEIAPETIAIYAVSLQNIPAETMDRIILRLTQTEDWFPTIKRIKEAWLRMEAHIPTASETLDWCIRELNRGGGGYDPNSQRVRKPEVFPDVLTAETVRIYGWSRLQTADVDWLPKEWEKAHKEALAVITEKFLAGELAIDAEGQLEPVALPAVVSARKEAVG
jgi:hypothetical protein